MGVFDTFGSLITGSQQAPNVPVADMTLSKGMVHAADDETKQIIFSLAKRVAAIRPHQDRLAEWCDRADRLFYAEEYTT